MLQIISTYKLFFTPVIIVIVSQFVKMIIAAKTGNFSWRDYNKYGGMPSSHSAFVGSLATTMAYAQGVKSPEFSIAFVLATIVTRDAIGLRRYLSNHSKVINILISKLPDKEEVDLPHIEERLEHTPLQVFAGLVFGLIFSIILLKAL